MSNNPTNSNKPTKVVTVEYLSARLERGWTMQDFCNDLNVSTEWITQFIEKRSATGHAVYGNFLQKIKENEKVAKKAANKKQREDEKKAAKALESQNTVATTPTPQTAPNTGGGTEIEQKVPANNEVIEDVDPIQLQISALQKKAKEKEESIATKEKLLLHLNSTLEDSTRKIAQYESNIEALSKQIEAHKKNLKIQMEKQKEATVQIKVTTNAIGSISDAISKINAQIRELQKVTVTALENGEVEINRSIQIPESYKIIYADLLLNSLVENITLKQIQQLAKLIALFNLFKKENMAYEFVFKQSVKNGNDSVKLLFELFTEEK